MSERERHMSPEAFRRHGRQLLDWIVRYRQEVEELPVQSPVTPGAVRAALPASPPARGEPFEQVLQDLDRHIVPGLTHWQSPRFFAFFPANASEPSILGDLVSSGLGVQGMLWSTSPACTEVETLMLDWLVEMLDLPASFLSTGRGGGVLQDTASSATLCALVAAREKATGLASNENGVPPGLVAYASAEAHSSADKSMMIAGLGRNNLRKVDVDASFAMRPEALEAAIRTDLDAGRKPFFVCATVGTTSCLALDPVRAIGDVCRRHGLWLHVDAALAGTAALCPEHRAMHDGLELADSYVFNPHKWMLTNFDCSAFWVTDRQALIDSMSVLPEYMRNPASDSGQVIDYRDWHVPLGRRFRALKLWFVIRHYGVEGLQAHVRRHVALADELAGWIAADADFELAAPPRLNLVCFRHRGGDVLNEGLARQLNRSGLLYLTRTKLGGRVTLRLCIGQPTTGRRHVEEAWQQVVRTARELTG